MYILKYTFAGDGAGGADVVPVQGSRSRKARQKQGRCHDWPAVPANGQRGVAARLPEWRTHLHSRHYWLPGTALYRQNYS